MCKQLSGIQLSLKSGRRMCKQLSGIQQAVLDNIPAEGCSLAHLYRTVTGYNYSFVRSAVNELIRMNLVRVNREGVKFEKVKKEEIIRPGRVWFSGPPPHVGWWNAGVYTEKEYFRWWDGKNWSCPADGRYSKGTVDECANQIAQQPQAQIAWSYYWPENARVPRVDPRKMSDADIKTFNIINQSKTCFHPEAIANFNARIAGTPVQDTLDKAKSPTLKAGAAVDLRTPHSDPDVEALRKLIEDIAKIENIIFDMSMESRKLIKKLASKTGS